MLFYGNDVKVVRTPLQDGCYRVTLEHEEPGDHGAVPFGQQCQCGWINLARVTG